MRVGQTWYLSELTNLALYILWKCFVVGVTNGIIDLERYCVLKIIQKSNNILGSYCVSNDFFKWWCMTSYLHFIGRNLGGIKTFDCFALPTNVLKPFLLAFVGPDISPGILFQLLMPFYIWIWADVIWLMEDVRSFLVSSSFQMIWCQVLCC